MDKILEREADKTCYVCGQYLPDATRKIADESGRFVLYQNDFRDIAGAIEAESVDAVICDPPYGSGGFTVKDIAKSAKQKYVSSDASYQKSLPNIDGDSIHPMAWRGLMMDALKLAMKALRNDGVILMFIDWRQFGALQSLMQESGFAMRGGAVWDKGLASRPIKNGFRNQSEFMLWGTKGKIPQRADAVYLPGVIKCTTMTNCKVHITQKPDALMDEIIKLCRPRGVVLDMFMGSGSTGVAALKSGRRFVGCESVPEYFNAALERCKKVP